MTNPSPIWIWPWFGPRQFSYTTPLAPTAPDCQSRFTRSFQHQDWVDGESVVQAGETATEEGFNTRFHKIEADLDAIKADLVEVFGCLATLRAALAACLGDVQNALNQLDTDMYNSTNGAYASNGFSPWSFPIPTTMPVPTLVSAKSQIPMNAYLGSTDVLGQPVSLWKTDQGMLMVPVVPTTSSAWASTGLFRAGQVQRILAAQQDLAGFINDARNPTVAEIVERFGGAKIGDTGTTLRDLLGMLAPSQHVASPAALVSAVAQREGAALRATSGTGTALLSSLGVDPVSGSASTAPVSNVLAVPANLRDALVGAGVHTVGDLANADPAKLTDVFKRAGSQDPAADVAHARGVAQTLVSVQ